MPFFLRAIVVLVFVAVFGAHQVYAQNAEVPITVEDNMGGVLNAYSDGERKTCDPEFWDVIKDKAWMEAQREITQNANIIARPDSTLKVSCFDRYLDTLGSYGQRNFPYRPDESGGKNNSGGVNRTALTLSRTRIAITLGYQTHDVDGVPVHRIPASVAGYETLGLGDSVYTNGIAPYMLLELLVLDHLTDGVTPFGYALDMQDYGAMLVCGGKDTYLDNFPELMLGGRAIDKSGGGDRSSFAAINAGFRDGVYHGDQPSDPQTAFEPCDTMARVWERAKCYDVAMESNRYNNPASTSRGGLAQDHDGFYRLGEYKNMADSDNDYRVKAGACRAPTGDGVADMNNRDLLCYAGVHGLSFSNKIDFNNMKSGLPAFIPSPSGANPTWGSALAGANPAAGTRGAGDVYNHYLGLRRSSLPECPEPIKLGFIVTPPSGGSYEAAFCPTPGCWFEPPGNPSGTGRCVQD